MRFIVYHNVEGDVWPATTIGFNGNTIVINHLDHGMAIPVIVAVGVGIV